MGTGGDVRVTLLISNLYRAKSYGANHKLSGIFLHRPG